MEKNAVTYRHPWRRAIRAEIRDAMARKRARRNRQLNGREYAARVFASLLAARGGHDLY